MEWYKRIKDLREDHDLTQAYIAKLLKTSQSAYSDYERNIHQMSLDHLIILSKYYAVTTDYILGLTDDPHHNNIKAINITQRDNNTINIK